MTNSSVETAANFFKEGYSCSQSIVMTYGKKYGMNEESAKTIARCFGGGMGRTCQTCGAVTGAFIVLGLKNDNADDKIAKEKTYSQIQDFTEKFKRKFEDVNCQKLLNCDLGTPEGQAYFRENELINKCTEFVRGAATILENMD